MCDGCIKKEAERRKEAAAKEMAAARLGSTQNLAPSGLAGYEAPTFQFDRVESITHLTSRVLMHFDGVRIDHVLEALQLSMQVVSNQRR